MPTAVAKPKIKKKATVKKTIVNDDKAIEQLAEVYLTSIDYKTRLNTELQTISDTIDKTTDKAFETFNKQYATLRAMSKDLVKLFAENKLKDSFEKIRKSNLKCHESLQFSFSPISSQAAALVNLLSRINTSTFTTKVFPKEKIISDLKALKKEFESVEYDVPNRRVIVTTNIVVLHTRNTDPKKRKSVDLGKFNIYLRLDSFVLVVKAVKPVKPVDTNYATNYCHPHVASSGNLCLGEASTIVSKYYQVGNVFDALMTINEVLHNYGPSPYVPLESWLKLDTCYQCGARDAESVYQDCQICKRKCCDRCQRSCTKCKAKIVCSACMHTTSGCKNYGKVCKTCIGKNVCSFPSCPYVACEACALKCSSCSKSMCIYHQRFCYSCKKQHCADVSTCGQACKNCRYPLCKKCIDTNKSSSCKTCQAKGLR